MIPLPPGALERHRLRAGRCQALKRNRYICLGLLWAATGLLISPLLTGASDTLAADQNQAGETKGESVRPEVGNPLQAAQELIKAQKYKQALAKIQEADGAQNKTAYENYVIDRLRGIAAAGAGDVEVAVRSFESVIASGRLSLSEKLKIMEGTVGLYYRAKDYPNSIAWASRYRREGGTAEEVRRLLIQAYYLNNDFPNAEKELHSELQADESAGRMPPEDRLQLLASCYFKQTDMLGYAAALEKLVTYYPKQQYWADLVYRIETKAGFPPRLGLDVYRLKLALGVPITAGQFMEMTQLALQAGFPAEAKAFVDRGFATGALGSGAEADRQKRLRDLATKSAAEDQKTLARDEDEAAAAKDGTALVNTGFAYVVGGQIEKGIDMLERGLRKGGLKRPDDARLHLGIAYLRAGQKERAVQAFKSVQGTDGTADLARLWTLYARRAA
jgi:tetratricopeptide (TPR) repeat protein